MYAYICDVSESLCVRLRTSQEREREAMLTGPSGQKRPADVIGTAVTIARIATEGTKDIITQALIKIKGGLAGPAAHSPNLNWGQRTEIAKEAISARWE
jgi:hypothetical protein